VGVVAFSCHRLRRIRNFLAYLGYGYLDTWHGVATFFLLPIFVTGLARSFSLLHAPKGIGALFRPSAVVPWKSWFGLGRLCLLVTAGGMIMGGVTMMIVGMTTVFVPQDLKFMGLTAAEIHDVNSRLVPLIAHDRAGFGGAICTCGIIVLFCVWCGQPSRSLWQVLCLAGAVGFSTALGVHPIVGYTDLSHLAPALLGAAVFLAGLALTFRPMWKGRFKLAA
jgi:hypothetical protein